jgi:hypothetical protein
MPTWLIVVLIWIGVDVFLAPVVSAWTRRGWEYELHARLHSRTMEASPRRVQNPWRNSWTRRDARKRVIYPRMLRLSDGLPRAS